MVGTNPDFHMKILISALLYPTGQGQRAATVNRGQPGARFWQPRTQCLGIVALFLLTIFLPLMSAPAAALLDVWRAADLNFNDGDTVGTWSSASNRVAGAVIGTPILKLNVTPGGGSVVRFNRQRMSVPNSPVGGRSSFSLAYVFRADAVGANDAGNNWYGKSGIIDAEQGGVTADWGTVITEAGQVGIGSGSPDLSLYSTGPSLVDSNYHVAVFTWGGGTQAVYVDSRAPISLSGVASAPRNVAACSFGGINTDENGAVRRFVGDLAEIRFYDAALTSLEASNVIRELRETHIFGTLPRIFSFVASTNQIYLGQAATLSWSVSNTTSVVIDNGIGSVAATGSVQVLPAVTTTYSLMATNTNGLRSAQLTIMVDPGVPTATSISTNTPRNSPLPLSLQGFDPQGSNLTYAIVMPPAHGTLSGSAPNLT